jgi:hypothetical protein
MATRYNSPWMPLAWAGRGLVALGESNWYTALLNLGVIIGLAVLIFGVALITAERLYYTGWASMQTVSTRKKKPARARRTNTNGELQVSSSSRLAAGSYSRRV